jgi:hypothetical protein
MPLVVFVKFFEISMAVLGDFERRIDSGGRVLVWIAGVVLLG